MLDQFFLHLDELRVNWVLEGDGESAEAATCVVTEGFTHVLLDFFKVFLFKSGFSLDLTQEIEDFFLKFVFNFINFFSIGICQLLELRLSLFIQFTFL